MQKQSWLLAFLLASITMYAQVDSLLVSKLGHHDNYQWKLNDVWGYADGNGNEYALVGAENGFDVLDVTNPQNIQSKIFINGAFSLWRDVKTWSHFAYVCHDGQYSWSQIKSEGILIVDLDSLSMPRFKRYRPEFSLPNGLMDTLLTAHNIFIDEKGILYVFGAGGVSGQPLFNGGALMFDLATDPWNPTYVGRFDNYYFHDGFARNDTLWAGAINLGFLSIVDVSQKSNPQILATKSTPNQFTHNVWLSDDGKTVYTTDEKPDAFVAAYDVSDLSNISELGKIRAQPGLSVIPHNVFVLNDFLVISYYTRGLYIVDCAYPDLLVEAAFYDTSPLFSGTGFNGAWGAYPYLPSGNILISDMEEGLYVLQAEYKKASRIYGVVKDSLTGNTIFNATIDLKFRNQSFSSALDGSFKAGFIQDGWDTLVVSKFGYQNLEIPVQFNPGNYDTLNLALLPNNFGLDEEQNVSYSLFPNPSKNWFTINLSTIISKEVIEVTIYNMAGERLESSRFMPETELTIHHSLTPGLYILEVTTNQKKYISKLLVD